MISCVKSSEENQMIKYSNENSFLKLEIIKSELDNKDSLLNQVKKIRIFDKKNRLINQNNLIFYYYNADDKKTNVKFIYKRGGTTNILRQYYIYDVNGNLQFVKFDNDTIKYYLYNKQNQLIEVGNKSSNFKTIYKFLNNRIYNEIEVMNDTVISDFKFLYNQKGNIIIKEHVFNVNQKIKTYYNYNNRNKLISERDSCLTTFGNPNEYVEYLTEYFYDKNDSLIEKRNSGRILSENFFKIRNKTKYEYKKL